MGLLPDNRFGTWPLPPFPTFVLQPFLARIVDGVAARFPELIERLGPHRHSRFLIDPVNLPFVLYLAPDPARLTFKAYTRGNAPVHDARIAGTFRTLLQIVDCGRDSDAMFFSRDLDITGNTEAVVSLRNAIDNVDGSIASAAAGLFGPPGRGMLALLKRLAATPETGA